eukprot:3095822-Amphidinium_carterae.1
MRSVSLACTEAGGGNCDGGSSSRQRTFSSIITQRDGSLEKLVKATRSVCLISWKWIKSDLSLLLPEEPPTMKRQNSDSSGCPISKCTVPVCGVEKNCLQVPFKP